MCRPTHVKRPHPFNQTPVRQSPSKPVNRMRSEARFHCSPAFENGFTSSFVLKIVCNSPNQRFAFRLQAIVDSGSPTSRMKCVQARRRTTSGSPENLGDIRRSSRTAHHPRSRENPLVETDTPAPAGVATAAGSRWRFRESAALRSCLLAERTRLLKALAEVEEKGTDAQEVNTLSRISARVRNALKAVKTQVQVVEPKFARSRRTIKLPDRVIKALKSHRIRQLEARLAAGERWREAGFVFTTPAGTRWIPGTSRGHSRRFCQATIYRRSGFTTSGIHAQRCCSHRASVPVLSWRPWGTPKCRWS